MKFLNLESSGRGWCVDPYRRLCRIRARGKLLLQPPENIWKNPFAGVLRIGMVRGRDFVDANGHFMKCQMSDCGTEFGLVPSKS